MGAAVSMDLERRTRHVWLSRPGLTVGCCDLKGDSSLDGRWDTAISMGAAVSMDLDRLSRHV
eukprot:1041425-Rhodomonas_salina.1